VLHCKSSSNAGLGGSRRFSLTQAYLTSVKYHLQKVWVVEKGSNGMALRITWEPVEKPTNWSLFEANRLNSPKLGVKFFDRLMDYTHPMLV